MSQWVHATDPGWQQYAGAGLRLYRWRWYGKLFQSGQLDRHRHFHPTTQCRSRCFFVTVNPPAYLPSNAPYLKLLPRQITHGSNGDGRTKEGQGIKAQPA